jgi:hypothetical protein
MNLTCRPEVACHLNYPSYHPLPIYRKRLLCAVKPEECPKIQKLKDSDWRDKYLAWLYLPSERS